MSTDPRILGPVPQHSTHTNEPAATSTGSILSLIGWIALCLLAGALGSIVSGPNEWYVALDKPAWTPPSSVFAPVWTTLYVLMGIAAWQVWRTPAGEDRKRALRWFVVQLALNTLWSWLFFGARRPDLALVEIAVLWIAIVATVVTFNNLRKSAGILLLPYLAWVTFAATLNAGIWWLN